MGEMKNAYNFSVGKPEWRNHSEDLRVDGKIIMDLREIWWEDVDWIHLAQDREQWWAFVNTVMNIWIPHKAGNSLTS
jgi:hypothetical protein